MNLSVDQDFPASLDRLWAVFSDPEYPRAKYAALGATHFEMSRFSASASEIVVELVRRIPVDVDAIPSFARKLLGDEQTMRHETRWRRVGAEHVRGELTIVPVGRPVRIVGTATLCQRGEGSCRLSLSFEITSDVPLIGGKLAKLFVDQVDAALKADHAFTLGYLARAR